MININLVMHFSLFILIYILLEIVELDVSHVIKCIFLLFKLLHYITIWFWIKGWTIKPCRWCLDFTRNIFFILWHIIWAVCIALTIQAFLSYFTRSVQCPNIRTYMTLSSTYSFVETNFLATCDTSNNNSWKHKCSNK